MRFFVIPFVLFMLFSCKQKCDDPKATNTGFKQECIYPGKGLIYEYSLDAIPGVDSMGNPWPEEDLYYTLTDSNQDLVFVSDTFANSNIPHVENLTTDRIVIMTYNTTDDWKIHLYGSVSGLIDSLVFDYKDYMFGGNAQELYPENLQLEKNGFRYRFVIDWYSSFLQ